MLWILQLKLLSINLLLETLVAALPLLLTESVAFADTSTVRQIELPENRVKAAFQPRRIALLVGVQNFSDQRFRQLQYPEKDVQDMQTFLQSHNHVDHDRNLVLLNSQATTAGLLASLDEISQLNTSENDIVLVYLSTHGTLAYEGGHELARFAVMHDTLFDKVNETGISLQYLQSRLSRLKSNRKALILALCHSGNGKSQLPTSIEHELTRLKSGFFAKPLHEVSSATMVLAASSWGQPAREDNQLKNDIYTHFLIKGLSTHDSNRDGAISLFEAHEFARSQTYDFTRGQQTPSALLNVEGTDPIILNGSIKSTPNPMVFADAEQFRNLQVYINGQSKGSLWQPQIVESGRVRLTLVDPRSPATPLVDHSVYMRKDQAYSVSGLMARQPTWSGEFRLYHLPLPDQLDDIAPSSLWAPGVNLRASELLGTRLSGSLSFHHRSIKGSTAIDYIADEVTLQTSVWRAVIGAGFYPFENFSLALDTGIEHLTVIRSVANDALDNTVQQASTTYPVILGEMRFLNLFGSFYAGGGISLYPARQLGLRIGDANEPLSIASASAFTGFGF